MRISDWSSDVCSSDLPTGGRAVVLHELWRTWHEHHGHRRHDNRRGYSWAIRSVPAFQPVRTEVERRHPGHGGRAANLLVLSNQRFSPRKKITKSRSEANTSELPTLMCISYAVLCL